MKTGYVCAFLYSLASAHVHAQTPNCTEWESKLKADINTAKECEPQYQACLGMGPPGNPMRELNYCENLLKRCQSLDGPIEDEKLKLQVEEYKKRCS
jgi:hypothetical protein